MTSELNKARHADTVLTHYITLALRKVGVSNENIYEMRAELNDIIYDAIEQAVWLAVEKTIDRINEMDAEQTSLLERIEKCTSPQ